MSVSLLSAEKERRPPFPVWRFSVADYHRLIEAGVLGENDRVELLEGWIVPKMTHNPLHDGVIQIVSQRLSGHLPAKWTIRIQSAITTTDSEPEPDIAIVRGDERTYLTRHPSAADIGLLIEVAESSLDQDRSVKSEIYARAGVANYWIVNLLDSQVEVLTHPALSGSAADYMSRRIFRGDELVPFVIDTVEAARIPVGELLP